jgi:hypothetical protein
MNEQMDTKELLEEETRRADTATAQAQDLETKHKAAQEEIERLKRKISADMAEKEANAKLNMDTYVPYTPPTTQTIPAQPYWYNYPYYTQWYPTYYTTTYPTYYTTNYPSTCNAIYTSNLTSTVSSINGYTSAIQYSTI